MALANELYYLLQNEIKYNNSGFSPTTGREVMVFFMMMMMMATAAAATAMVMVMVVSVSGGVVSVGVVS